MIPTVAQEGASGDTSLAPGLLPAQRSRCDISLQPWRDVLQEGRAGAMLSAGMRMERGPRLPDPLRVARVAPCPYPANQDADTGEIPLRLHGKVRDVCCVQHWRQMLERRPLAAVTLSRQLCPSVPLRRGCSHTISPALSCSPRAL